VKGILIALTSVGVMARSRTTRLSFRRSMRLCPMSRSGETKHTARDGASMCVGNNSEGNAGSGGCGR
jgi:hypothetical protein